MKEYKYIQCSDLELYSGWEIVKIIESNSDDCYDMAVIMKENKPVQGYTKLDKATNEQLLDELNKRLIKED